MVLLLDLGNQSLHVGVYENRIPVLSFRLFADRLKSEIEYEEALLSYLTYHHLDPKNFEGAILSSVVPSLTKRIENAASKVIQKPCLVLNNRLRISLSIRMDNPSEVGSDLLATALGAINNYQKDTLVIDMGNVVSFLLVSEKREYLGGALFPGLRDSADQMIQSAALLSEVDLKAPKKYLGKNSRDSISAGVLFGYQGLIESYAKKLEEEVGKPLVKVLTGADAKLVKGLLPKDFLHHPTLCFDGLYDIYQKNTQKGEK